MAVGVGFASSLVIAFLFRGYLFNLRQQVLAADMLTEIVSSFNKSIEHKEKRIVDLMMRVELLELKVGTTVSSRINNTNVVTSSDVSFDVRDITLNETELKLVKFISDGPKKISDVRVEIGKTREHTSRVVKSLVERKIIEKRSVDGQVLCYVSDRVLEKLEI